MCFSISLSTINNLGGGEEERTGGIIEWRKKLSHLPFAQKAAQFMMKTGLLGQFEDLQGEPMRLWHGIGLKKQN